MNIEEQTLRFCLLMDYALQTSFLDCMIPTAPVSIMGEIPIKLCVKLGTKLAWTDGWLTKVPDAKIGWSATSTEAESDVIFVISRLSLT